MKIFSLALLACIQAANLAHGQTPAVSPTGASTVSLSAPTVSQDIQYRASLEFEAIATEVYRSAIVTIADERKNAQGPFAVVLDLDETVLDNTEYEIESKGRFNGATWNTWVTRQSAGLVPGSKNFLDQVRTIPGAHVVFITDRSDDQKASTLANLVALDAFKNGDVLLTKKATARGEAEDTKAVRRECVEKAVDPRCSAEGPLPIIALFGDSARDFEERYGDDMNTSGRASVVANAGSRYWVIPNPIYGQWQQNYK